MGAADIAARIELRQTLLDRLIGWASPEAGRRRLMHRAMLDVALTAQTRAHEAASRSDGWHPRRAGASGDADVMAEARVLRDKARHLRDNVGFVARGLQSRVDYAVGTGVVRKWSGPHAKRLDMLWRAWARQADADGVRSLDALEAAAVHAMDVDGGVLLRLRARLPEDGLAVPLQIQLIEVDWIDETRTQPSRAGNAVINGYEYDMLGRWVGAWLWDQHPGSGGVGGQPVSMQSRLVPASVLIPLDNLTRPGQRRGLSRLAPLINTVRDLHLLKDAELARRNLESRIGVIASGDPQALDGGIKSNGAPVSLGDLPSGGVLQLPGGLNLTTVQPNAAPGYLETVRHETQLACAAMGCTYEAATGDLSQMTLGTARQRRLDFMAEIERLRWHTIDPFAARIDAAFVEACRLARLIPAGAEWSCEHYYPRWRHLQPVQDVQSEVMEIAAGLRTVSAGVRERGDDPAAVHAELGDDAQRLMSSGALDLMTLLRFGHPTDPAGGGVAPAGSDA